MKEKTEKKKRGRPPKKPKKLPKFKDETEIREYILRTALILSLECKEIATKKNNIKNHQIANAKNQQYKTALTSLKVANDILKDLQINKLEDKVKLIEESLLSGSGKIEPSEETLAEIEKLAKITEKLAEI